MEVMVPGSVTGMLGQWKLQERAGRFVQSMYGKNQELLILCLKKMPSPRRCVYHQRITRTN